MSEALAIRIFCTGGTIDKIYDGRNFIVGDPEVERILGQSNVRFQYQVESICKKDSLDLTSEDRELLLERIKSATETKIIVTHGTDTITETAKFLQAVKNKTIILMGAMSPAKFIDSDATFNIGGAVIACQTLPAGIYLISNGLVLNPLEVKKNPSTRDYISIK